MQFNQVQDKVNQFNDKTKVCSMLIDAIETLDDVHGTSLIQFDDEVDEDTIDEQVTNDNELATKYIYDYVYAFNQVTNGCYWNQELYNAITTKYDVDVVEFVNSLVQVNIYM